MPTKKKRINIIPDNLPSLTEPSDFVPSVYTGNKLAEKDPQKYSRIVLALGERKPVTRIAKDEKCSPDTVMAIAKREKKSIDAVNELTAGLTACSAQACVMKLIEKLEADQIPVGVLPKVSIQTKPHKAVSNNLLTISPPLFIKPPLLSVH